MVIHDLLTILKIFWGKLKKDNKPKFKKIFSNAFKITSFLTIHLINICRNTDLVYIIIETCQWVLHDLGKKHDSIIKLILLNVKMIYLWYLLKILENIIFKFLF